MSPKKAPSKPSRHQAAAPLSQHPITEYADQIRDVVHGALAKAGISDLSLRSMQFDNASNVDPCPNPKQRRTLVCRTQADGSQVCSWECVDD
jgi:hypothetical protein